MCSEVPAWKRLISYTLTTGERIPLITTIFSDRDEVEMVRNLSGDDAQTFIDMTDEVRLHKLFRSGDKLTLIQTFTFVNQALDSLTPEIRGRCYHYLYTICGRQALLPRSLEIPLCYDPMENPLCRGGFADVWKGQYHGWGVAAKVLRVYPSTDPAQNRRVSFQWCI